MIMHVCLLLSSRHDDVTTCWEDDSAFIRMKSLVGTVSVMLPFTLFFFFLPCSHAVFVLFFCFGHRKIMLVLNPIRSNPFKAVAPNPWAVEWGYGAFGTGPHRKNKLMFVLFIIWTMFYFEKHLYSQATDAYEYSVVFMLFIIFRI